MSEFKLNISQKEKSYNKSIETTAFKGKKIGDKIPGDPIGLEGYELEITGGSDSVGFPMRPDLKTVGRRKVLIVEGIGIRKNKKGIKKRKTVIGNQISLNTRQINLKVIKEGAKKLEQIFSKEGDKKPEEKKQEPKSEKKEAKREAKTEDKKEEPKKETKADQKEKNIKTEENSKQNKGVKDENKG